MKRIFTLWIPNYRNEIGNLDDLEKMQNTFDSKYLNFNISINFENNDKRITYI